MKKRILLIVPLPPPMHGSNLMNFYVVNCKLLHEKYDVEILPLHYADSIDDIGSFRVKKVLLLCFYLSRLIGSIFRFNPDVVYFVPAIIGPSFYRDCLFAGILKLFRVKIVYHIHGKGIKSKLNSPFLFCLYRWFFRNSSIIHLSPMLFEDIKSIATKDQCYFLPNGIEAPAIEDTQRKESNIVTILFLSNLVLTKGPIVLLEACQLLKSKDLCFKVLFVGNPTLELRRCDFKKKVNKMGLEPWVEYIGPLYNSEKHEILSVSDMLVFPTYYKKETFGLVILEAMAYGLPIISTREGAIPEIVDEGVTGFLVEKKDAKMLSERIEQLILDPQLAQQMGKAGRYKFDQMYTLQRFHKNLVSIFDEIFLDLGECKC